MKIGGLVIALERDLSDVYSDITEAILEISYYRWDELGVADCDDTIDYVSKRLYDARYKLAKVLCGKKAEIFRKYSFSKEVK